MAISVGSVEVDVIPNTRGIYQQLRGALVPAATRAGENAGSAAGRAFGPALQGQIGDIGLRIGQQIGRQIASRVTAQVRGALRDGIAQGGAAARPAATRQGDETGGAFGRAVKTRLEAAFRSLPKITIGADTSEADSDLQALRARMETLAGKRIGVDIDTDAARAEITEIEEQLRRLGAAHPNVAVRADTAQARVELAAVREEIDRISARPGRIRIETDGSLGQRIRAQIQAAEAALPNINIGADASPAQAEIASLRGQLTALRDQRIGIDIDASTALARVTELRTRLQRLSASDVDIAVRVDAANAVAQLAMVQAMVNRVDSDVSPTVRSFGMLVTAAAAFGPAILPALPIITAGLGAVAAASVAAGVGLGGIAAVAIPAFKGIATTLQAQKTAQDAATAASLKGGQAAAQGASRALQMAGAQQALASAERNGARQIAQAQQQVRQAKVAAADAVVQAAQRNTAAARSVEDAEKELARSQKDSAQAQQDLVQARRDAAAELEDLNSRLAGAQLSQRDAVLGVREAQAELTSARAEGSKATQLDVERAQLAYDQAVQRLKDQQVETKRLATETALANKAGVDGSDTVRTAQEQLAQAQEQVADRTRSVRDAQDEAARTQIETARQIADAQQRVGEATENVAVAQQSAADAVASAQRQIASASASAAGGVDQAAIAQAKYQAELAKLTPAARGTLTAFTRLKTAFTGWSESLQPKVMPLFTRALIGLRNSLPGLTPFVVATATAIAHLQDRVSRGFKSPWWQSFKKDLAGSVGPAVEGLGVSFGRIFKGMAGVIDAFLPHMDGISERMQRITGRFANWGTGLKGSPEFERFLAYSSEQAPFLAETLGNLMSSLLRLGVALAPMAGTAQSFINALTGGLNKVPVDVLTVVGVTLASIAIGSKLAAIGLTIWRGAVVAAGLATAVMTGETVALNAAMRANLIGLIVTALIALVVGLIYAYQHCETFRNIVQAAWRGIVAVATWAWKTALKPIFDGLVATFRLVGVVAVWLWENVLSPVFKFIWVAAKIMFTIVVVAVLLPIIYQLKALGAVAKWLWKSALSPVFGWIGTGAKWLWDKALKPAFGLIRTGMRQVGSDATWLWKHAISPAFGWIADRGRWLWEKQLKPAFGWVKAGLKVLGDSFTATKDTIGKQWSKLADITKKPIAFIVNTVYGKGIRPTWNTVAKAFGAPPLPVVKGFARGGILPGASSYRQGDDQLVPMRRGEGVAVSEAMRDPYERQRLLAVNQAAMRGQSLAPFQGVGFAKGGIFDWIGKGASAAAGAGSKLWGSVKSGASWLKDTIAGSARAGLNAVVNPLLARIPGAGTNFGKMVRKIPSTILDAIFGYSTKADDKSVSSIGGVIPTGQHAAIISQALAAAGVPPPGTVDQWQAGMNTLISRESGWNASAINLWDSNAKAGHPSQGLTQTIPSTWSAYVPSSLRSQGILDPVGNVAASIRYIVGRYGGIGNVQQANANLAPKGYDSGGYLQPGLNLAYNGTGRPEPVFTTQQANALTSGGGTGGFGDLSVKVFVGNEEIHHIARAEIHKANGELIQVLSAGGGQ